MKKIYGYSTWDFEPDILITEFPAKEITPGIYDITKKKYKRLGIGPKCAYLNEGDFNKMHTMKTAKGTLHYLFLKKRDDLYAENLFRAEMKKDMVKAQEEYQKAKDKYLYYSFSEDTRTGCESRSSVMRQSFFDAPLSRQK